MDDSGVDALTERNVTRPFNGVSVVEFADLALTRLAGMLLFDLGADVTRIDRRTLAADVPTNFLRRGRRSICLDLKHPDGFDDAKRPMSGRNVSIEVHRPRVVERRGLGPTESGGLSPRLVHGQLTGRGQTGPFALAAGHDITYLALSARLMYSRFTSMASALRGLEIRQ